MSAIQIVVLVLVGGGFVASLIGIPVLEFLESKNKVSVMFLNIASLFFLNTWAIGMVIAGINSAITTPQYPEAAMVLGGLGGICLVLTAIGLILDRVRFFHKSVER